MTKHFTFIESATETTEEPDLLLESVFVQELTGKKWKVRIIEGDTQGSSAYYSKEMLEAHSDVVKEGTRIYIDHMQEGERPERKAASLAGTFASDSFYENGSLYAEIELFSDQVEWVKERAKKGVIGLSIHGSGQTIEENGRIVAQSLDAIHSVDIVTHAGAGGAFIEMTESDSQKEEIMELPKELLEALDNQDKQIQAAVEGMTEATQKMSEVLESMAQQEQEQEQEVEESAPTASEIAEALLEAKLTESGRKAVYAAVEAGTELEEAITTEKDREKAILEESNAQFGTGKGEEGETTTSLGSTIFG